MGKIAKKMGKTKIAHVHYKTGPSSPDKRLHNALLNKGFDSNIITLYSGLNKEEGVNVMNSKSRYFSKINTALHSALVHTKASEPGGFSFPLVGTDLTDSSIILEADVIFVHWALNGFMSLRNLRQLFELKKPTILVMHDMWYITGGCYHSTGCDYYETKCANCKFFGNSYDLSVRGFNAKKRIYSRFDNLSFVAPSRWLYQSALKSALTSQKPVYNIPNVLEKNVFKPIKKKVAKSIINYEEKDIVIAFGAKNIQSPYKGIGHFIKALEIIKGTEISVNIKVLLFGSGFDESLVDDIPFETNYIGSLISDYALALMYNCCDVFVAPSLADNLPYAVLESLSCGTPVVAFNVGGMSEMIKHKENGYLATQGDFSDIAKGIEYCIAEKIKGYRLPDFEPDAVMDKYIDLINKLID